MPRLDQHDFERLYDEAALALERINARIKAAGLAELYTCDSTDNAGDDHPECLAIRATETFPGPGQEVYIGDYQSLETNLAAILRNDFETRLERLSRPRMAG